MFMVLASAFRLWRWRSRGWRSRSRSKRSRGGGWRRRRKLLDNNRRRRGRERGGLVIVALVVRQTRLESRAVLEARVDEAVRVVVGAGLGLPLLLRFGAEIGARARAGDGVESADLDLLEAVIVSVADVVVVAVLLGLVDTGARVEDGGWVGANGGGTTQGREEVARSRAVGLFETS